MARHASAKYPYRWPDGSYHSRAYAGHGSGGKQGGPYWSPGGYGQAPSQAFQNAAKNAPAQQPVVPGPNGWIPDPGPVGGRPIDPAEEAYRLSANRNVALGNANATYQTGQLEQQYGYGASGAANPYSRAALLQESFQRSKLGTMNSAGNQLYSGSYGRAQNENQHQYSIASDQNRRAYDQAIYGVKYGQAQNTANYGVGVDDAAMQALIKALGGGN